MGDPQPLASILFTMPLFSGVGGDDVQQLANRASRVELSRGDVLFVAGEKPKGIYLVEHGWVALTVSSMNGAVRVIDSVGEGRSFGEALVFLEQVSPVTATATVASTVVLIPGSVVLEKVDGSRGFTRQLLAGMSRRLFQLVSDRELACATSARERIVAYLIRGLEPGVTGGTSLRLPEPKRRIADRLSMTPETLSRSLREMVDEGLITVRGRTVHIPHLERLKASLL